MILSKWKGHLKLLQPVTVFCDLVALATVATVALLFQPVSFLTSWIFKLFHIEEPSILKWGILSFAVLSLSLKYWMFRYKGIKDSQWVDKKWLKEFHQFTPSQLDHYADAHFRFHRLMAAIWIGAALMNFSTPAFVLLGVGHVFVTYYWKAQQQVKTKAFLPHGEMEHFPMEVIGAVQNPMEIVHNLQERVQKKMKDNVKPKLVSIQSSSHRTAHKVATKSSAAASHARHTLKKAAHQAKRTASQTKQEVKHGAKNIKNEVKSKLK